VITVNVVSSLEQLIKKFSAFMEREGCERKSPSVDPVLNYIPHPQAHFFEIYLNLVRFDVLTAVSMKITVFWVVAS
jgi:hypothetical protein